MLDSLVIREATREDIPALAALHVKTWNETYPMARQPPAYQIRERQWREQFDKTDGTWFCFVVENPTHELVGFAKGNTYHVARRFLGEGISTMVLFGTAENPSRAFHEALGGEKLYAKNGEFHGGYAWNDLRALAAVCPIAPP